MLILPRQESSEIDHFKRLIRQELPISELLEDVERYARSVLKIGEHSPLGPNSPFLFVPFDHKKLCVGLLDTRSL